MSLAPRPVSRACSARRRTDVDDVGGDGDFDVPPILPSCRSSHVAGGVSSVSLRLPFGPALGLVLGPALGLVLGLALGLVLGPALGLVLGPALGLVLGPALGLALGLVLGPAPRGASCSGSAGESDGVGRAAPAAVASDISH